MIIQREDKGSTFFSGKIDTALHLGGKRVIDSFDSYLLLLSV